MSTPYRPRIDPLHVHADPLTVRWQVHAAWDEGLVRAANRMARLAQADLLVLAAGDEGKYVTSNALAQVRRCSYRPHEPSAVHTNPLPSATKSFSSYHPAARSPSQPPSTLH
eukprot:799817-Prorocentrum_minimum.AAC.3